MKFVKPLSLLMAAFLVVSATGCSKTKNETKQPVVPEKPSFVAVGENGSRTEDQAGFQLELPSDGEEIVVLETTAGAIYIRLFPESAPIAVTNFKALVENGYYDRLLFHRVINDFMIQSGDPLGTGTGGESVWGADFEDEFNANLVNIRGALSMANSGANTNGSQFFINQAGKETFDLEFYQNLEEKYLEYYNENLEKGDESFKKQFPNFETFVSNYFGGINPDKDLVTDEIWELYKNNGGNINLDGAYRKTGGHTVFGQVFEGLDVVDEIASSQTDTNARPKSPVTIKKAYITTYKSK